MKFVYKTMLRGTLFHQQHTENLIQRTARNPCKNSHLALIELRE